MFKKKHTGEPKRKVDIADDGLDEQVSGGLGRPAEVGTNGSGVTMSANFSGVSDNTNTYDASLHNQRFSDPEDRSLGFGSASAYIEAGQPTSAFFKLKNKQKGVPNVFSVNGHAKILIIDDSRLVGYDNLKAEESQTGVVDSMMIEETCRLTFTKVPSETEQQSEFGSNRDNKSQQAPIVSPNFRVSTSRLDSYINSSLPIKYKPLESGSDELTQELMQSGAATRSKSELAAFYASKQSAAEDDDIVSHNQSHADRMQEEFRARKLEQELQKHKNSSMSRPMCYPVHRVADDIAAADVSDINIAITAKSYARCDADMVEEIGESPKDVEEFEMYEKFILQNAVKNRKFTE